MTRVVKMARRPAVAAAWWGAWWAWRNRPTMAQWGRFGRDALRNRRPLRDVVDEGRVRVAFASRADLRRSSEVEIGSVVDGVVHLHGVPGGADTDRAALAAARIRGVSGVEVHDKIGVVESVPGGFAAAARP